MTEVTQTDRDAALRLAMRSTGGLHPIDIQEILEGRHDKNAIVTAFARHRLEERAAIVAWLMREEEDYPAGKYSGFAAIIREEIEAGEHLK